MSSYVLDTSAVFCVLFAEDGAGQVLELLRGGMRPPAEERPSILLPFVALMEMEYWLLRRLSPGEAERTLLLVDSWPVRVHESTPAWRHEAARIKAATPLSLGDAWIASLALLEGGELVHKDPEYDRVAGLKALRLPYGRRR